MARIYEKRKNRRGCVVRDDGEGRFHRSNAHWAPSLPTTSQTVSTHQLHSPFPLTWASFTSFFPSNPTRGITKKSHHNPSKNSLSANSQERGGGGAIRRGERKAFKDEFAGFSIRSAKNANRWNGSNGHSKWDNEPSLSHEPVGSGRGYASSSHPRAKAKRLFNP